MPELPEIYHLAQQMDEVLREKRVAAVDVRQPKCLNVPVPTFESLVVGKTIGPVSARGKWVFVNLDPGAHFLLSLGMGGDALYHEAGRPLPEKYQVAFRFTDESSLSLAFFWFGYAHAVRDLGAHAMTASLGLDPLDSGFTYERFSELLEGRRGAIKPVLMDQTKIAGIGNVYIQDILFRARLHPNRKIPAITEQERRGLYAAIRENLRAATDLGGLQYERDLFGHHGRFKDFLVGYREGQPCPECGTAIEKIRAGSTATFICPKCQKL
jgi:formamidopyrimidine-DNA glycosylase